MSGNGRFRTPIDVMDKAYRIIFFSKHKRRTLYSICVMRGLRRIGCTVRRINMHAIRRYLGRSCADRVVRRVVDRFRPDAIIVFSGDIQKETLEYFSGRVKTAVLLDDFYPVDAPVTEKIKRVDVFFHTMTGQLEEYRAFGVKRPVYVYSGVDPYWHHRSRAYAPFVSDVAFIGKASFADRIELIKALDAECDLKVYGAGWQEHGIAPARREVGMRSFSRICASARIILGIDKTADKELYFSNRTWFVLGSGGFLLTRYVPGLERLFANHKHLVWYRDREEALDQIRFYLRNDALREQIAANGYALAHSEYPFDRMARNIVGVLFEGREPTPPTDPGPSLERGTMERSLS